MDAAGNQPAAFLFCTAPVTRRERAAATGGSAGAISGPPQLKSLKK